MKKLILTIAIGLSGGAFIAILVHVGRQPLKVQPESQLPTAMSNYSRTFKLNTTPPIWGHPTNGNPTR